MIEIKITGDTADDIGIALKAMLVPNAKTIPLDDLIKITKERFGAAGFVVSVSALGIDPDNLVVGPENKPTDAEAEAIVDKIQEKITEALAVPKKRRVKPKPEPEVAAANATNGKTKPAAGPDDRAFVLDELAKRFSDPKQKHKTKAFIDSIASQHGGVRLSLLAEDLFPDIRQAMEAEFGGGNDDA
jgi:hypothetical protein